MKRAAPKQGTVQIQIAAQAMEARKMRLCRKLTTQLNKPAGDPWQRSIAALEVEQG